MEGTQELGSLGGRWNDPVGWVSRHEPAECLEDTERARFELAEACTSPVFKTGSLNHSDTSPRVGILRLATNRCQANAESPEHWAFSGKW